MAIKRAAELETTPITRKTLQHFKNEISRFLPNNQKILSIKIASTKDDFVSGFLKTKCVIDGKLFYSDFEIKLGQDHCVKSLIIGDEKYNT